MSQSEKVRPIRVYRRRSRYAWWGPDGTTRHEEYVLGKWGAWCRECGWGEHFVYANQQLALNHGLQHLRQHHGH